MICGTDRNNQVLAADFINGTMYVLEALSEKGIQKSAILSDVQTPLTRSVIIDQNKIFGFLVVEMKLLS